MKFSPVVALVSVLANTLTEGYTFSDTPSDLPTDSAAKRESTGLTVNAEARIFGGSEADASLFPFIVSLRENNAGDKTYCGGTLIASQYVVTAGHCVKMDEATIYASIGSAFGSGSRDGQQVKVIERYRHPLYNESSHMYDVGVLKLESAVSTETIDLCAADGSDNEVGTVATVRGWGFTENGSQSLLLKEVNVQIISNNECNKQYNDRITEGMLCAGDGNGKDSCSGDSGGPLIANDVLVGIVSWGGKCGVNSGVYTRVSYVQDYINDIVSGRDGSSFASGSINPGSSLLDTTRAPPTEMPVSTLTPTDQYGPSTEQIETTSDFVEQSESSSSQTQHSVSNATAPSTSVPSTSAPPTSSSYTHSNQKDCAPQF